MTDQAFPFTLTKGSTCEGRIIKVGNAPERYQDKDLYPVTIRSLADPSESDDIKPTDLQAKEVVFATQKSIFSDLIGQEVRFAVVSPASGNKPAWIKLDQHQVTSGLELAERLVIANNAFKISADLLCCGKAGNFKFEQIDELAKRVADKIIILSKMI